MIIPAALQLFLNPTATPMGQVKEVGSIDRLEGIETQQRVCLQLGFPQNKCYMGQRWVSQLWDGYYLEQTKLCNKEGLVYCDMRYPCMPHLFIRYYTNIW